MRDSGSAGQLRHVWGGGATELGVTPIEGTDLEGSILASMGRELPPNPFVPFGAAVSPTSSLAADRSPEPLLVWAASRGIADRVSHRPFFPHRGTGRALKLNILRLRLFGWLLLDRQRRSGKELSQAGLPTLGEEAEYSSCWADGARPARYGIEWEVCHGYRSESKASVLWTKRMDCAPWLAGGRR